MMATCAATLTDRETVITCEGHHAPGSTHMAEFFGAVYSWEPGAAAYKVWPIFGSDWRDVAVTQEVLGG